MFAIEHAYDVSVCACSERLSDAVNQQRVVGTGVAVRQQVMGIRKVHVMPYGMVDGRATIVQVECILVGVSVASRSEGARWKLRERLCL